MKRRLHIFVECALGLCAVVLLIMLIGRRDTIDEVLRLVQLVVGIGTFVTLAWGLAKMFESAEQAKEARIAAVDASHRAEKAAQLAAEHAVVASADVRTMAENVLKIELATNSMKDALVVSTERAAGLAGEERGRRQASESAVKKDE